MVYIESYHGGIIISDGVAFRVLNFNNGLARVGIIVVTAGWVYGKGELRGRAKPYSSLLIAPGGRIPIVRTAVEHAGSHIQTGIPVPAPSRMPGSMDR